MLKKVTLYRKEIFNVKTNRYSCFHPVHLRSIGSGPMNVTSAAGDTQKLQTTIEPTSMIGITVEVVLTSEPEGTPSQSGLPMSTLIIFGLIAVLAIAVVIGGMALMSRRQ